MASMDQFEAYFKRADLDGDGRISGAEAVAFFQGSGLAKPVLAQIWTYADQSHSGFLDRQEFFNALRLVTVAQSKRDLTPDIVKAALHSHAASKIPAPKINVSAPIAPGQQPSLLIPSQRPGGVSATASQSLGSGAPGIQNASINQNYFSSQQNMLMRPNLSAPRPPMGNAGPQYSGQNFPNQFQAVPAGTPSRPPHPPHANTLPYGGASPNLSNDLLGAKTGASLTGIGVVGQTPSTAPRSQAPISVSSLPGIGDSKALVPAGHGPSPESGLGSDGISATSSQQKSSVPSHSLNSTATLTSIVPAPSATQPSSKTNALDSLQGAFLVQPSGSHLQQSKPIVSLEQQTSVQGSALSASSGNFVGNVNSNPPGSQLPWPKMKPSDIQKYTKVFMEVDTDRDGKITGVQARNLFLSWRLPREVLKHVWDLADQDNDTMLSLREFCFALFLMERYREGRPLPTTLPRNLMFDETLLSMTGPATGTYGNVGWTPRPGLGQHDGIHQPVSPATGLRPPVPAHPDGGMNSIQQKAGPQVLDPFAYQIGDGEQNSLSSKPQETTFEEEKVDSKENVILDSKEKIEFYRTKMQDIVLYRSRCDNRLNEISERASADKREAEMLGKKYEEKYKQVAEIASKLTIEEARFREIQERKTELHQAIVNMEQGGSADGILQVRADRIQSDLEELLKALVERCKRHELDVKSKALVELPFGWQPGIQEGAAVWDEEWDKFEDDGFHSELTFDGGKQKIPPDHQENGFHDGGLSPDSSSHMGNPNVSHESESVYGHSEDESGRSPRESPTSRSVLETPLPEYADLQEGKGFGADPLMQRVFDDSNWGAFDTNDDADSVWGFSPSKSKEMDVFGSGDFGVTPVRTGSPSSERSFQRKSPFVFDDSVPSTPMSRFGNSPPRFSNASRDNFDSFSRFDSFNVNEFSGQAGLTRFDSMSSTRDFGGGFSRFDSVNSTRDFGGGFSRFDSMNSSRDFGGGERFAAFDSFNSSRDLSGATLTRFDSINSTKDFGGSRGFSFDDNDPFGSGGPFKIEPESKSSKKDSDNWSAF